VVIREKMEEHRRRERMNGAVQPRNNDENNTQIRCMERCMEDAWKMHRRCMEGAWKIQRICR